MSGTKMEINRDVVGFLHQISTNAPNELRSTFSNFEQLYDKKLWHQLTLELHKLLDMPAAASYLIPLYNNFIVDWQDKMNQIMLVQYLARASQQSKDPKESLDFLVSNTEFLKEKKESKDAYCLSVMEAAHYKLIINDSEGCKAAMDECEKILDDLPEIEPVINASFYKVSANYYKVKADYPQYYRNALLYLSSINIEDLSNEEKVERAYELAISALLGEGLYNFGELIMHPILESLVGTSYEWLKNLLYAYNSGNIDAFNSISNSGEFLKESLLVNNLDFLRRKLCLMSLIEHVFQRTKEERGRISFSDIASETKVAEDEVEHLIMKAFSLGILKGKIDQVDKIVMVTWVQPRVLDLEQINSLKLRLDDWIEKVNAQTISLENDDDVNKIIVQ
ncbi:PCI-domain-containing protein [Neocallimastix lanati (nom. inval.)]|jgi:26S proteasome regulatory subunit N9|uniref:PCI-domain-containing protein n=1 Tax=Neocallimastix californiae TaxID=1754190 RepID=A0A1Y2FAX9_9FUNG|nr:PCI-domain-containing protein [Neocallimastix sp. JGI-2020a]ORY81058.1 PCI-domain-containing protein [Neocallimastix californiae]|eukprot:ORY81058.1 PCI-domain-containing protein [Neocallimastix californiae]